MRCWKSFFFLLQIRIKIKDSAWDQQYFVCIKSWWWSSFFRHFICVLFSIHYNGLNHHYYKMRSSHISRECLENWSSLSSAKSVFLIVRQRENQIEWMARVNVILNRNRDAAKKKNWIDKLAKREPFLSCQ